MFDKLTTDEEFIDFLTLAGYDCLEAPCVSEWPWGEE
jgi:hypothetical protein